MQVKAKPRRSVRIVGWVAIIASVLLTAELGTFVYYTSRDGRFLSARSRLVNEPNSFVEAISDGTQCRYIDTLYPHPYVAFVHHNREHCPKLWLNPQGLFGRPIPFERDLGRFTILLTGGSVASQLGQTGEGKPLFLEEELNRCYRPPHGNKFLVLNLADGAWKQPQQAIVFLLYADIADAVVTLDGFNEHNALLVSPPTWARLEVPANNFAMVNPIVSGSYVGLWAAWLANATHGYVAGNELLNKSFLMYASVRNLKGALERMARKKQETQGSALTNMFVLPAEWPVERKVAFNQRQYRRYIRAMATLAASNGLRSGFFIQPAPAIGKTLNDDEKRVVGDLRYADAYQRMNDDLVKLAGEGISIFSLLDVFSSEKIAIYSDNAHFIRDRDGESRGNRLVAAAMARRLSEAWQLERICP